MRLIRLLAGSALIATLVVLLSSEGVLSQEKKDKTGKITGHLPPGWKDLNLTAAQKEEVYKVEADAKEKIDKLELEVKKIKEDLGKKRLAVLTDEQRKKLRDSVAGEDPKDKPKDQDKDKPME